MMSLQPGDKKYRCTLIVVYSDGRMESVQLQFYPPSIVIKKFLDKGCIVNVIFSLVIDGEK